MEKKRMGRAHFTLAVAETAVIIMALSRTQMIARLMPSSAFFRALTMLNRCRTIVSVPHIATTTSSLAPMPTIKIIRTRLWTLE